MLNDDRLFIWKSAYVILVHGGQGVLPVQQDGVLHAPVVVDDLLEKNKKCVLDERNSLGTYAPTQ